MIFSFIFLCSYSEKIMTFLFVVLFPPITSAVKLEDVLRLKNYIIYVSD